jgi:hypothetical protein
MNCVKMHIFNSGLKSLCTVVSALLLSFEKEKVLFVFLVLQTIVVVFSQPGSGLYPPRVRGFLITHHDASELVGLLLTSDQSVAETST